MHRSVDADGMLKPLLMHFILFTASQLWIHGCVLLNDGNGNHLETLSLQCPVTLISSARNLSGGAVFVDPVSCGE